jgi:hypothetical protein
MMAMRPAAPYAAALGAFGARLAGMPGPRRAALAASFLWTVLIGGYGLGFLAAPDARTRGMAFLDGAFLLLALALPLILIWLAAWLAGELGRQRAAVAALTERAAPLLDELAATRRALAGHGDAAALGEIAAGQRRLQAALDAMLRGAAAPSAPSLPPPARPAPPRPAAAQEAAAPRSAAAEQPPLPLEPQGEDAPRPDWNKLVRALDFPRDPQDFEGFRALQAVLRYRPLAQLLQAAEDVLTLLSQEGLYMDDVAVEPVDAAAWRRFMAGTRGAAVAGAGGIRDPQTLELTDGLLKTDAIFRDTALFFQGRFDRVLGDFARDADDAQIADLANTRSGRAFMLLARLAGSFG